MTTTVRHGKSVAAEIRSVIGHSSVTRQRLQSCISRSSLIPHKPDSLGFRRRSLVAKRRAKQMDETNLNLEDNEVLFEPFMDLQLNKLRKDPSFRELALPVTLSKALGCYKKRTCTCTNRLFVSNKIRKLRTTRVDAGAELQIFNSCLYPSTEFDLPILGVDLLHFGRKTICIVDFQPLEKREAYLDKYITPLSSIKKNYPFLNNTVSNRFYDDKSWFSDQMLYLNNKFHLPDFYEAFEQYLRVYLQMLEDAEPMGDSRIALVSSMHSTYDKYNKEKDPAIMMFSKIFGKDFSTEVTESFLFSL